MKKLTGANFSLPNLNLKDIEVVEELRDGTRIIQNVGEPSVQWTIPKIVFEATYVEKIKANPRQKTCRWNLDSDEFNTYRTDCENMFVMIEGNPVEHGFKYCVFCGGKLK